MQLLWHTIHILFTVSLKCVVGHKVEHVLSGFKYLPISHVKQLLLLAPLQVLHITLQLRHKLDEE